MGQPPIQERLMMREHTPAEFIVIKGLVKITQKQMWFDTMAVLVVL